MRAMRLGSVLAIVGGLAAGAAQAGSVASLVGTYDAKFSCKGLAEGVATNDKGVLTMRVLDITPGRAEVDFLDGATRALSAHAFIVFVTGEAAKPARGTAQGAECTIDGISGIGSVLSLAFATKPSGKVTLRGTLIRIDADGGTQVCAINAKRTSAEAPVLPDDCSG
jgi:hypothetical protein